jgi:hypothetical protein
MAGLEAPPVRLQRHNTTDDDEPHSEALPIPTRYYPFIIIAHPRAVVAQSALSVLKEIEPNAEVLVVADRYNFDDSNGSRLYTGSILSRRSDADAVEGRQMITSFTASKSKFDEQLSRSHKLSSVNSKNVTLCADAHVVRLDVENKVLSSTGSLRERSRATAPLARTSPAPPPPRRGPSAPGPAPRRIPVAARAPPPRPPPPRALRATPHHHPPGGARDAAAAADGAGRRAGARRL